MATPTTPPPTPAAAKKAKAAPAAPPLTKGPTHEQYGRLYYEWVKASDPVYLASLIRQGTAVESIVAVARHAREVLEHNQRRGSPQKEAEELAMAVVVKPDFDAPPPANPAATAAAIAEWEEGEDARPFLPPRAAAAPKK